VSEPADILYEGISPAFSDTDDGGTRAFTDALALMIEPFWAIAQSNWNNVFDVDAAPATALDYLAQFSGAVLEDTMTDDDKRDAIRTPSGFMVGTPAAMVATIQRHLIGSKSVIMIERPNDEAYRLFVRTQAEETPSQQRVNQAILAQKPAGIILDIDAVGGQTYDELRDDHSDYMGVDSVYVDYSALLADIETGGGTPGPSVTIYPEETRYPEETTYPED
jgi:hypothetical protein